MNRKRTYILALCFLLICGWVTPSWAQTYTIETIPNPKQSRSANYVSNPDKILSVSAVKQIDALLGKLEDSTTAQVAVVCVNSIGEYVSKDFATALFRKWGLGYQKKNNGLLVLLVKDQHRFEMETGYGLEGILPDAICSRIQTQKMVPLAKAGDLDGAMIAGVEELTRLISQPEAVKEVYDESKYTAAPNRPLDGYSVMIVFILLIPVLLVLRLFAFFLKKNNSITEQIEKAILKTKGRLAWAFLVYMVIPICIGLVVIQIREKWSMPGWQVLLVLYAYTGVVVWDGRRRRKKVFAKLFGTMTEPERYVRYKAARLNGWGNRLLFPIPFWWVNVQDNQELDVLRNHNRKSAQGDDLTKVEGTQKEAYLTAYQKVEEELGSKEYDIWRNGPHDITEAIGYENLNDKKYQYCNKCGSKAMYLAHNRILTEATTEREGRGANDYECKACGHHREAQYTIAISRRSTSSTSHSSTTYSSSGSSSSSSWGSSSSSSSSSSSWGGGSSGGGGAGSSW